MPQIACLLLPGFSHLGLAAAIEPLFVANWLAGRPVFEWVLVSPDGRAVEASNGTVAAVAGALDAAAECRTVFVLASFEAFEAAQSPAVLRWLRRAARFGVELGGLENGSIVLAEAGLLDGHRAAIHWDNLAGFAERYPKVEAVAELYARSGKRLTCGGNAAILDLTIAWIGWQGEPGLAAEVAEHLLLGPDRLPTTPQLRDTAHPAAHLGPADSSPADPGVAGAARDALIASAEALMLAHLDEPLSCAEIASGVGLSLRQLERRFAEATGRTVLARYRRLRLAQAHRLLQQTRLSVTEIAVSCGYPSPEYFARVYRDAFGRAPSRDRRQSTAAPVLRRERPRP